MRHVKVLYGIVYGSGSIEIPRGIPVFRILDLGRPFPSKAHCSTTCPITNKIIFKF